MAQKKEFPRNPSFELQQDLLRLQPAVAGAEDHLARAVQRRRRHVHAAVVDLP